jgi:hypothetical protein
VSFSVGTKEKSANVAEYEEGDIIEAKYDKMPPWYEGKIAKNHQG